MVVEEIFGGSPWVIFSHTLSAQARGVDLSIKSTAVPSVVKFGTDTVYIKHEITDNGEPHIFDADFDPYHVSRGYKEATVTAIAGGKDPCSLIVPDINTSAILDPARDNKTITIYPDATNSSYTGGPKTISGTFLELKVEVTNATNDNWVNTTVTPDLTKLGASELVMSYVAYPRPLVPDDNIGTFTAGWRFNQPENEVLIKIGNSLPEIQPTRRAYFIFLLKIDPSLKKGIHTVPFSLTAVKTNYKGTSGGNINYEVPPVNFAITEKDEKGNVKEFQKFNIDRGILKTLDVNLSSNYNGLGQASWSGKEVVPADFGGMKPLPVTTRGSIETIDLSKLSTFQMLTQLRSQYCRKALLNLLRQPIRQI
ncbi:MAG: hypothetical protein HC905_08340 [Bacteroidales bacterium]|nr:hypothetical protein [Bacteroidales bacterium]